MQGCSAHVGENGLGLFFMARKRVLVLALKNIQELDISRSFIRTFAVNREDTFTRFEKYPSKLDISRSFIRTFVSKLIAAQYRI